MSCVYYMFLLEPWEKSYSITNEPLKTHTQHHFPSEKLNWTWNVTQKYCVLIMTSLLHEHLRHNLAVHCADEWALSREKKYTFIHSNIYSHIFLKTLLLSQFFSFLSQKNILSKNVDCATSPFLNTFFTFSNDKILSLLI